MSRFRSAAAAAAVLLALAHSAAAQTHLEISAGMGRFPPSWQGTYLHAYPPRFLNGMPGTGPGRQTLTFEAQSSSEAIFGAAFFVSPRFAIQILYDSCTADVSGTTSTHDVTITYTSQQPPDYVPRTYTSAYSNDPARTGGQWTDRIISLNALYRIPLPAGFDIDLSAGGSWFHTEGDLGYPEFTKFWLGGRAVLFSQTYSLQMVFDPIDRIGWNAGAALGWALGANAALWAEARYFGCAQAAPRIAFHDTGAIPPMAAFDPAADIIPVGDLTVDPSGFRIGLGFKFLF
jgi:hypothetical protein